MKTPDEIEAVREQLKAQIKQHRRKSRIFIICLAASLAGTLAITIAAPVSEYRQSLAGFVRIAPGRELEEVETLTGTIKVLPQGSIQPIEKPDLTYPTIQLSILTALCVLAWVVLIRAQRTLSNKRVVRRDLKRIRAEMINGLDEAKLHQMLDTITTERNQKVSIILRLTIFFFAMCIAVTVMRSFSVYHQVTSIVERPIKPDLELVLFSVVDELPCLISLFFFFLMGATKEIAEARAEVLTWLGAGGGRQASIGP